ncbi:Sugar/inositol transporter [Niveomyces insectorum RCEF 264]|uniref:Sugar/inositol transporter n=1 Tax=Niveomyces insectorum RCEF 264 TaxID=1081102 RepID=A0A168ACP9_9HYPO|nr:Sugar/inositol transporter [Niveomyces insectorum RCEF 264]
MDDTISSVKRAEIGAISHVDANVSLSKDEIARDALLATQDEHAMTFWQAIKRYRKACFWSGVVSLTIIMDGYDTALLGSLQAFPAFQYQFGHEVGNTGKYQVDAKWQVALGLSNPIGNIFGIIINSAVTERYGHKKSLLGTLVFLTGVIFISFFATNVEMLFAGELLSGLCWGVFTTMAPAYASEVCPVILRSYFETFVVLCWGIGQFISFGVLAGFSSKPQGYHYSWRIPIAVQWMWPVLIFSIVLFAPESPWWLVRRDRIDEAEKSLLRLTEDDEGKIKQSVALMVHTNNLEKALCKGASVMSCFTGTNLRRTEIACMIWCVQQFGGFVITGYATYFFEQAGLKPTQAFHMSVGQAGLHFVCTLVAFWLTGRVGRRPLALWGMVGMAITMFIIGFVSLAPSSSAQGYAESAIYLLWYAVYELTIGPIAYIVVGEVSTTRLRSQTVGLARNAYNLVTIVNYVVGPYILNPTEGNWKGKCGFLTGGLIVMCLVWGFYRIPETGGRTYEELDILFAEKVPARKFKDHQVDVVASEVKEGF